MLFKTGTILTATHKNNPDDTFQLTWLSGFVDIREHQIIDNHEGLSCRYYVKAMDTDGRIIEAAIWLYHDGRTSLYLWSQNDKEYWVVAVDQDMQPSPPSE